ncbi:MAG: TIGR01621 family pseudouridine synthase [Vibrio sp.]
MFDILLEHSDFVVINKHPGISVHKDDGETMLLQEVAKVTNDAQLFLVHRLDKMTSGVLLLARHATAARLLSQQFAQRAVNKWYLAIGAKKPKKKQGTIIGDMTRSRRSAWKLETTRENPAVTQFLSVAAQPGQRLFLCKPYTGKTHQIRVALKSVGSAILGDPIYHQAAAADRGYLHAFVLQFTYDGTPFTVICDPRDDSVCGSLWSDPVIANAIEQWLAPWELLWPALPHLAS